MVPIESAHAKLIINISHVLSFDQRSPNTVRTNILPNSPTTTTSTQVNFVMTANSVGVCGVVVVVTVLVMFTGNGVNGDEPLLTKPWNCVALHLQ